MKLSRGVARFNKRVTNRIQGLYAWVIPPWAVVLHRGRRSGRRYRTPLFAFRRGGTLAIALLYGEESDWLRNVRTGGGHVVRRGRTFVVGPPEVVETAAAGSLRHASPVRSGRTVGLPRSSRSLSSAIDCPALDVAGASVSPGDPFDQRADESCVLCLPHVSLLVRPRVDRAAVADEAEQTGFAEFSGGPLVQALEPRSDDRVVE